MADFVKIVVLDFHMCSPIPGLDVTYSEFRGASVNQVPILRCFGSTKNGQKICVHIHGVFPYLYIPYDGVGNPETLMYQIATQIDKAVNTSLNQGSSSIQHVYKISLVSGIPMYGYHPKKHQFFKIYLYNPLLMSTVTKLLLNRALFEKVFQPHEAHINFTLQFMIDYNLHGMSNMVITDMKYRINPDNSNTSINSDLFLPANIEKNTECALEADINAENILNRQEIINGNLAANPGIAALWADEQQRRRNKNENSQLGHFLDLQNMKYIPTKTHIIYQKALVERLAVLSTDKKFPTENLDISVYPAETPKDVNLQNASIIDLHTPSSLELSLDDTMNVSTSQYWDNTITSTQGNSNVTMDEDVINLLQVLEKLAAEKAAENQNEDDSILSQHPTDDEQNEDTIEDFYDLRMPLASATTPKKVELEEVCDKSDDEDDNYFNTTLVPQVDGQTEMTDSSDDEIGIRMTRSRWRNLNKNLENDKGNTVEIASQTIAAENQNEDDSILSQNPTEDEHNEDTIEDFHDLSMPLAASMTPKKMKFDDFCDKSNNKDDNYFNTTLVQVDGQTEMTDFSDDEIGIRMTRSRWRNLNKNLENDKGNTVEIASQTIVNKITSKAKCCKSMPELDVPISAKDFNANLYEPIDKFNLIPVVRLCRIKLPTEIITNGCPKIKNKIRIRKTQEEKFENTLRLIRYRINRICNKNKIKRIGKIIFEKETQIKERLQKVSKPKFNVVPGKKWFLDVDIVDNHPYILDIKSNIYFNCDGAYDSSSEDEKKVKTNNKRRKKVSGVSSQYAPLQISTTKSPRVLRSALKSGLAENVLAVSEDTDDLQDPPTKEKRKTVLKSNINFKRKINFDDGTHLNSTTLEENISCEYSPKINLKTRVFSIQKSKDIIGSQTSEPDASQDKKSNINLDVSSGNSQSVDEVGSKVLVSTFSDSDLFSEDDDMNKSFFRQYHLTASERYDRETKFKAKEGCSTIFSSNSISDVGTLPSQKIATAAASSGHSSSDIPPYQESQSLRIKNKIQDIVIGLSSENVQTPSKPTSHGPFKLLKPIINAPTRNQVEESLDEFKIPHAKFTELFYSNVQDCTGAVEIGHSVLKIPSKTTVHLSEFETDFNSLCEYRKMFTQNISNLIWNSNNLKSLKLSHCATRNIVIRPIKKPPTVKMVQDWLRKVSDKDVPVTPVNVSRSKMYIPRSPGRDEDDLELSLSVTPCTPATVSSKSLSSDPVTPKTSLDSQLSSPTMEHRKKKFKRKNIPQSKLPSISESVLISEDANKSCQITGVSQNGTYGFNRSVQNMQAVRAVFECQNLTTMVMELHIRTRGDLKPDPEYDPICAVFYSILNDVPETNLRKYKAMGVIASNVLPIHFGVPDAHFLDGIGIDCDITYADTEHNVINSLLSLIKYWDPDIFAGYEIQMLSWGYLIDRALVLSINIIPMLGRSKTNKYGKVKSKKDNNFDIETVITGRIILDVWRLMRYEIALQSYTFESIVYHILHRRVPMFPFKDLTFWWDHPTSLYRHRVVSYYLLRVDTVLELFHKLDFLNRTSELASLFGIQFYEVLSRGSQFRVESMMLRLAKPLNYVPVSPSQAQRAAMKAPEYIALVMEPESKLYNDPVIVLDFQSLYPSIIIAYNYCFTTCVGRVNYLGSDSPFEFGATHLKLSSKLVEKLSKRNLLNFAPCGVAFVKQKVRQGILPRMLTEILDTRLMVKNSMKENKDNETLRKVLHNRQLGLKLIANVTYGYTAANFSGRMCCVEVGDSVVSKARETLQRAIAMVETTAEWGAKVVYGDTDSLFVMVPGKTKEIAFEIGKKIADAVTADNPDPIKLKLEKVYQPCILQTKKRYVGYMYESADQKEPVYDAKGIETVRRDGCPAVSKDSPYNTEYNDMSLVNVNCLFKSYKQMKIDVFDTLTAVGAKSMLQKCLTLLFETKDVSLIKKYVLRQFQKIQIGRASIQDLTFAKEYRGASGYKPGACVPALELARKWKAIDRRSEPRSGERVPYIIVNGPPGLPLIRLVRSPRDLLNDSSLRPNSLYYITKVIIPPINRCLNLIGADVFVWFSQMPRKNTLYLPNSSPIVKSTISQYFISKICASCSRPTQNELCDMCAQDVHVTAVTLAVKLKRWEENHYNTKLICHSCTSHINENNCISLDCPVLYRLAQTHHDLQQSAYVREITLNDIFSEQNFFKDFF